MAGPIVTIRRSSRISVVPTTFLMPGGRLRLRVMGTRDRPSGLMWAQPGHLLLRSRPRSNLTRCYLWPAIKCPGIAILAAPGVYTPQSPRESHQAIRTDIVALCADQHRSLVTTFGQRRVCLDTKVGHECRTERRPGKLTWNGR
jgi:hypothetical protein